MVEEAYGQSLGRRVGAEASATLGLELFQRSKIAVTRVAWESRRAGFYSSMPLDDAFMICLELRDLPAHPYWVDGKLTPFVPMRAGNFTLLDLRQHHASELTSALDCVAIYLPYRALQSYADEHEVPDVNELCIAPAVAHDDPVVRALLGSLLPALERPQEANRLFLDYVAMALIAHMTSRYGGVRSDKSRVERGGLAAWQERRAKDALMDNIAGTIKLEELAELCDLSRSHFARAFKQSTGLPPHRWLLARRVERAQDLLLHSSLSLDSIAEACGFSTKAILTACSASMSGSRPACGAA